MIIILLNNLNVCLQIKEENNTYKEIMELSNTLKMVIAHLQSSDPSELSLLEKCSLWACILKLFKHKRKFKI